MKLTGKCLEDFEVWFNEIQKYNIGWFYRLQPEYQYGVYVDYFDSVGIVIEIYNTIHGFDIMINTSIFKGYFKTRQKQTKFIMRYESR
jgi:hypothetical protein